MKMIAAAFMLLTLTNLLGLKSQDQLAQSMERGKALYYGYCNHCHLDQGQGLEGVFPPLASSDYLMADKERSIRAIKYGLEGEIVVNGVTYNNIMAPQGLNDGEVADVLNYIRNSWGNNGEMVKIKEVTGVKPHE